MFTFGLDYQQSTDLVELTDPRGGRVINANSNLNFNNTHVPYQGGLANRAPIDPAGYPTSYLWFLPYVEDQLSDASTIAALNSLRHKAAAPGGQNAQRYYRGMTFGVSQDE